MGDRRPCSARVAGGGVVVGDVVRGVGDGDVVRGAVVHGVVVRGVAVPDGGGGVAAAYAQVQSCMLASHAALRLWFGVPCCGRHCAHEEGMRDDGLRSSG